MIFIDFIFRACKSYYPQVFLEECQYIVKEKKIPKYVIDDIEISSDSDEKNSDEDNSDEDILEKTQTKKNSDEEDDSSGKNSSEENSDEKN